MNIDYQLFSNLSWEFEIFFRLLATLIIGAMVGLEREHQGRPAGMRTHILVALGAAILSIISVELSRMMALQGIDESFRIDPSRLAAGVVTGIGFLGAGTIIKLGRTARGLTTAASIWCIASIGMGFGFGLYRLSILGAIFMLFTLVILGRVERRLSRNWYKSITIEFSGPESRIVEIRNLFKRNHWQILDLKIKKNRQPQQWVIEYDLRMNTKYEMEDLVNTLQELNYIESFRIE